MKKNRIFLLVTVFVSLIAFSITVKADENDYIFYENKGIKKICKYAGNAGISIDKDGKDYYYLYIYNDNTASIGWEGTGCDRTNKKGKCVDGYKDNNEVYSGILNWSKNSTKEGPNGASDAYEYYSKNNECPGYLAKSESWGANRFYLSAGSSAKSLKNIVNANDKTKGDKKKYFYNIDNDGENSFSLEKDLVCEYKLKSDENESIKITFGKNGGINANSGNVRLNAKLFSASYLSLLEKNKCPKHLDACEDSENTLGGGGAHKVYMVYGDSSVASTFCDSDKVKNFVCEGENCSTKDVCQLYSDYLKDLKDDLEKYKNADDKTKTSMLDQYNKDKSEFNEYCVLVLKTLDYVEGNCIDMCISLNNDVAKLEIDYGLRSPYAKSKCNIGGSIVSMAYNVLKWAKYIAPALVIILTMLDFIKAIAAQNDDDMKKAQGKFVKRLIVAALLFLLPLIINFILQTFGLYDSSCDITDLF